MPSSPRPGPPRPDAAADAGGAEERKWRLYVWVVALVLLVDVATKVVAQRVLPEYRPVPVLGDYFRLTYIFNPGAAFGLHLGGASRVIFGVLALLAVVVLYYFYRSTPLSDWWRRFAIALVTGGAIGNLIDRVRSPRGVIDFFDVGIGELRWPIFNIADIAVTTGAVLLAISLWREESRAASDERAQG